MTMNKTMAMTHIQLIPKASLTFSCHCIYMNSRHVGDQGVFTFESMTENVLQDGNKINKLWR